MTEWEVVNIDRAPKGGKPRKRYICPCCKQLTSGYNVRYRAWSNIAGDIGYKSIVAVCGACNSLMGKDPAKSLVEYWLEEGIPYEYNWDWMMDQKTEHS